MPPSSTSDLEALHFRTVFTSPSYVVGALALLLTTYGVGKIIYNIWFHPLSKFPGPRLYAATYIPWSWYIWTGDEHLAYRRLHEKYGEVVRIAPDSLSYVGAQAWKDIYGYRTGMKQMPKDILFYNRTGQEGISDIIFSNDADHSRFRRSLSNAFSDKALRSSEPILNVYFDLLISKLRERASSPNTSVVDMTAWYNWTTFDIIGDLAMGEPFHALENAAYHPYILAIFQGLSVGRCFRILRHFGLQEIAYQLLHLYSNFSPKTNKAIKAMHRGYGKEIMAKRLSPERKMGERQDFMYHVLRQDEGRGQSREELEKNASILVLAGSETTATFLSGTTFHLLQNPAILRNLTDEVRGAFKSADEITLASTIASQMPYLHAVIEEGLRMYPPVPNRLPRRTTQDTVINGEVVPPNTSVGAHQLSCTRNPKAFHNPDTFEPRRWLPSPPAPYDHDELDGNQPFSTGPRNCLGKNLAYGEMRCILARMVWNFDLSMAKDAEGKELSHGWDAQKSHGLWIKPELWVDLKLRA